MRVDHVVVSEIRMIGQARVIADNRSHFWHDHVGGQPRIVVRMVHWVRVLDCNVRMDMLWRLDGVGHVQVLAFRVNVGLLGVIKVHDFVHHTVSCDARVDLFYVSLTMVCLVFRIVSRFANWIFRQDFFFFDICKVKLRAVSFCGSLVSFSVMLLFLMLNNNWLFPSLSWPSLMLFWLDLALSWSCALLDWLLMTFDWLGTMLNRLRLTLSLLCLVFG